MPRVVELAAGGTEGLGGRGGGGQRGPARLDRGRALQDRAGERKPRSDGEPGDGSDGHVTGTLAIFASPPETHRTLVTFPDGHSISKRAIFLIFFCVLILSVNF